MTVLAGRFEIEEVAGQGGMGTVFRARDRETHHVVAVKVVEPQFANARFEREAKLLAQLEDEAIVGYVAHGQLDDGRGYLAMEWLEGEPLDARLERGPLSLDACVAVAGRVARALAVAHAHGVVHRDVKPANVILEHGDPARARLVDFGIARVDAPNRAMTATGVVIGTPAYMAPEQARGHHVEAPADVFSLGCVLFECLCGRPAFVGEHAIAVLAKILFEPAPAVSTLRPGVPSWLESIVTRALEKEPAARFADGIAVGEAINARAIATTSRAATIGTGEARLATVVLAKLASADIGVPVGIAPTEDASRHDTVQDVFAGAGARFGVTVTALTNGLIVGVVTARDGAVDAAERAARCALAIAAEHPSATIVLSTGRAVVGFDVPVGAAIDAAARLLVEAGRSPGIFIDAPTARIIEPRFELARDAGKISIAGVRTEERVVRTFQGMPTPFVGRDRELAVLEGAFGECVEEPVAQAVLVVAPPGIGKSRLRRELVERLRATERPPEVWIGFADPWMQDAPFALVGDVFRRALGILEDEPLSSRRAKVLARVPDRRAAIYIGEVAGAAFDEADEPALRAARNNPGLLASQLSQALAVLGSATLSKGPLLIVLEDVHWADAISLRALGELVASFASHPLMLLGLARPSVDETHPGSWATLRGQRMVLQPLLKKAAARLAQAMVGEGTNVDAVVERAEGNALFVEELVRARLGGGATIDLPPTIAAATEARLLAVDADARVVLRAGAVFGERFWRGAVAHLVGETALDERLATLERSEIVTRSSAPRFAGEVELVFRHALLRDAAYAMLTDADRKRAHAAAAEWLESRVDDAVLLARHYENGGRMVEAARWFVQAAEDHLAAGDFERAVRHADRASELGAVGPVAGRAALVRAHVHYWRADNQEAHAAAARALELLEPASEPFFASLGLAVAAAGKLGDEPAVTRFTDLVERTPSTDDATGRARAIALARAAMQVFFMGAPERGDAFLDAARKERGIANDASVEGWLLEAAHERAFSQGDAIHPSTFARGSAALEEIGDRRRACMAIGNECMAMTALGADDEMRVLAGRASERFKETGPLLVFLITLVDAHERARHGDDEMLAGLARQLHARSSRFAGAQALALSVLQYHRGAAELAVQSLELALPLTERAPPFHALALAHAARLALDRGDLARAVALSDASVHTAKSGIAFPYRYLFDVSRIEVLEAAGDVEGARAWIARALDSVRKNAVIAAEYAEHFLERRLDTKLLVTMARARGFEL